MNRLENIVPKSVFSLWENYATKQQQCLKKEASVALLKFIAELKQVEIELLTKVVFVFTDFHREETLKIDFRLFKEILFPVLLAEVKKNSLTANRRLAQFDQFLLTNQKLFQQLKKELNYKREYFELLDFYKKEINLNSRDFIAIEAFLSRKGYILNYYIHEFPENGLLCNKEVFIEEFTNFNEVLILSNQKEKWEACVQQWELIK